jgi:chromate reductase, NAD(P)H dehydrogenase (quinone)
MPTGLITASASGQKRNEELQLIMKTAIAKFERETTLLIQEVKGKFYTEYNLVDTKTNKELKELVKQ